MTDLKLFLQLFGEGGDGGAADGGTSGDAGASGEIPGEKEFRIPERAREMFRKSQTRSQAADTSLKSEDESNNPSDKVPQEKSKVSYEDLIKSDEYKDEHKAYMDKTIGNRLKKYKGMEAEHTKSMDMLSVVAQKYGVDTSSETFLDDLKTKIDEDDSYYEQYAMEHDMSPQDARKIVTMERKLHAQEEMERRQAQEKEDAERIQNLLKKAEETKAQFPEFDLDTSMQDERFRRMLAVTNGDTTSAYMATNWKNVIPNQIRMASTQAAQATANAVANNLNRPVENGMVSNSNSVTSVGTPDFAHMNLAQLRAYADEQRRKGR